MDGRTHTHYTSVYIKNYCLLYERECVRTRALLVNRYIPLNGIGINGHCGSEGAHERKRIEKNNNNNKYRKIYTEQRARAGGNRP